MKLETTLKNLAQVYDLTYREKKVKYLACARRAIIIRNFLSGCPDPLYARYGNQVGRKRPQALVRFVQSKDFEDELKKPHGCVIHKAELLEELSLIRRIPNNYLRAEVQRIYEEIQRKIGKKARLSMVERVGEKEELNENYEVPLHELIHELMEKNDLRLKSWKWNEGLVTFLTHFAMGTHRRFLKKPRPNRERMWSIYADYTHRWAMLLRNAHTPSERRKILRTTIERLNKSTKATRVA